MPLLDLTKVKGYEEHVRDKMAQKAKDKAPYVAKTNQSSNGHDIAFNKKVSVGDMAGKKQGLQTI